MGAGCAGRPRDPQEIGGGHEVTCARSEERRGERRNAACGSREGQSGRTEEAGAAPPHVQHLETRYREGRACPCRAPLAGWPRARPGARGTLGAMPESRIRATTCAASCRVASDRAAASRISAIHVPYVAAPAVAPAASIRCTTPSASAPVTAAPARAARA